MTKQEAARILDIKQREAIWNECLRAYGKDATIKYKEWADQACAMGIAALIEERRGEWRPMLEKYPVFVQISDQLGGFGFYCSECDNQSNKKTKYCAQCGARME